MDNINLLFKQLEVLPTIVGIIALIAWVSSIQCKDRSKFLKLQIFSNLIYALEYVLLGAFSAVIINLSSTVRSKIYYDNKLKGRDNNIWELIIFIGIIIISAYFTYNNYLTILVTFIAICYAYASWQRKEVITRYIFTFGAIPFMYYNFSVGAYFFVIGNIVELVSGIIAIARYDLKLSNDKSKSK